MENTALQFKLNEHDELQPIVTEQKHCEKKRKGFYLQSVSRPKKYA